MGKEWTIPEKKEEKKVTVIRMLTEISDEICDKYCKYPDMYLSKNPDMDPDLLEDTMYTEICANCPLSKV